MLPSASNIDYSSPKVILDYQLLLLKHYEAEGALNSPRTNSPAIKLIDHEADIWLKNVETFLLPHTTPSSPTAYIPSLLSAYDLIHRACRQTAPPIEFLNSVRKDTADRWLAGDKSLSQTRLMLLLWHIMDQDRRYRDFCLTINDTWIRELLKYGRFRGITNDEAALRLNHILSQDLTLYLGPSPITQSAHRRRWSRALRYISSYQKILIAQLTL
ncbi:MAG: hypothetical protein HDR88_05395 [Bacteroides sp.]|nr:hypothetical protein [Bacteroides sp.]